MKNRILSFLMLFLLSLLINCSFSRDNSQHYQREWMLVSFEEFTKQKLVESKAGINLTAEKMTGLPKGSATMGCNTIDFKYKFKNNGKVRISNIQSAKRECENTALEIVFLKKIETMTNYKIEGHFLTFFDEKGNEMKFLAADWD